VVWEALTVVERKSVNAPLNLVERVDEVWEDAGYASRADFVRSALRRLVEKEEARLARMAPVCELCGELMVEIMELSANPETGPQDLDLDVTVHCPRCGEPTTITEDTEFERVTQRDRRRT
jgi:Arc/MetJ-type ribon-helix-helix transcriptional regulator